MKISRIGWAILGGTLILSVVGLELASRDKGPRGTERQSASTSQHPSAPQAATTVLKVLDFSEPIATDLHRELDQLKENVRILNERTADGGSSNVDTNAPQPERPFDPAAVAELLEDRLKVEAFDGEWTRDSTKRVRKFMDDNELSGTRLKTVVCSSSLCRAQLQHDSEADREALLDKMADMLPPDAEGFAHLDDLQDKEIEVYFSRTGPLLAASDLSSL